MKLSKLKITATDTTGEKSEINKVVKRNKVPKLSGLGLSSFKIYELQKTGKTSTVDANGVMFELELSEFSSESESTTEFASESEPTEQEKI